jgi:predicted RND superfamily exporter protein
MARPPGRDFVETLNETFASIAGWCFDHRWWVVLLSAIGLAGSLALASTARIDNSMEAYFDEADESFAAYDQYREDFGSDEVAYILYEAPGFEHGPWNLEVMRKIDALTTVLEDEVPFVYEAQSLANAELIRGTADGIDIDEIRDDFPETQAELLALREAYLAKPMLVGGIVSADGRHAAISIEMDRSSTDPIDEIRFDPEGGDGMANLYPQASQGVIDEILARPEYAGIEFHASGDVPFNTVYNTIITTEGSRLDAITAAVIGLLLALVFRSLVSALAPLVVVQTSVIACVAFVAALGWKLDMSFGAMPTLLTAIGVAHSVHILSEFRLLFAELGDRRAALVKTMYLVGTPCMLTSLTTAAGFGALSSVPIKSLWHYGIYGAFGVMAAFVLSMTLLMALLSFGRTEPKTASEALRSSAKGSARAKAVLGAIAAFNIRNDRAILAFFGLVFFVSILGIAQLRVDSDWLSDFSDDVPIKHTIKRVDAVMGGATNLIYLFDSGEEDGIKDPATLREIERVAEIAAAKSDLVRKSYSLVDILKDLNQAFHGDDPAYHTIPETRELVAQYLVLYEMSGGEEAEEFVSSDYRRASLELRLAMGETSRTELLVEGVDAALAEAPLETSSFELTGIGALWLKLLEHLVTSQARGFLLAFTIVGVMMIVVLRSFRVGAISMLPNLLPVVLTLGAMGWLAIPLDYSKISIAAVALGIAVDDTIHLVMRFRHEFRSRGNYAVALREAMQDVGRALLITSLALVCGFLVLTLSVLDSQATYGILLAVTIVTALIADFLLMPALVLTFQPFGPEGNRSEAVAPVTLQEEVA